KTSGKLGTPAWRAGAIISLLVIAASIIKEIEVVCRAEKFDNLDFSKKIVVHTQNGRYSLSTKKSNDIYRFCRLKTSY
ncbi:hypothetical protein, partial [Ruthenibacterium lactatiformans]